MHHWHKQRHVRIQILEAVPCSENISIFSFWLKNVHFSFQHISWVSFLLWILLDTAKTLKKSKTKQAESARTITCGRNIKILEAQPGNRTNANATGLWNGVLFSPSNVRKHTINCTTWQTRRQRYELIGLARCAAPPEPTSVSYTSSLTSLLSVLGSDHCWRGSADPAAGKIETPPPPPLWGGERVNFGTTATVRNFPTGGWNDFRPTFGLDCDWKWKR